MKYSDKQLEIKAKEIWHQCRMEYPNDLEDAVWDMCEAVICAEGLKGTEASRLRLLCGL
jgi:hypothetical protein